MKSSPAKCDQQLLRDSLDDVLSEQQEDWLEEHLEACTACQEVLAELASDAEGWSRVESALVSEVSGTTPLGRGMISTLVPGNQRGLPGESRIIGRDVLPADFAVDFLEPAQEPDSIGRLNDIEIRSVIGHGGNGIVLKGFQKELNRLVAVKVMAPQLAASAEARKRFAREAQATAAIVHPNVMPVLTVHSQSQLPYLVMPYVDCESLQQRLDREGSLPILDVLRIGHQVARGLAAAHAQGLVHRDVKPANILLERNVDRVMLTDFGLARAMDDATLTGTGLIAGTPQYMSPEQARGDSVCLRSDLFSLGSVMYAMCTGRPPFRAQTSYGILRRVIDDPQRPIGDLNADVPDWLEGFIDRLLAKESASRFGCADDVASMLQRCIAHVQQPSNNRLPEAVQALAGRRSVSRPPSVLVNLRGYVLPLIGVLAVVVLGAIGASGVLEPAVDPAGGVPGGDAPRKTVEPSAAVPLEMPSQRNEVWHDGVSEELSSLAAELDALLDALETNVDMDHQTRN